MDEIKLRELIKSRETGDLLFYIQLPIEINTLKKCSLCVTESQLFIVRKYKILKTASFHDIEINQCKDKQVLLIKINNELITAHFKKLDLLNSLFLNLQEKIEIERDKHLKLSSFINTKKEESLITPIDTINSLSEDLYATVKIGRTTFLIRSSLSGGLNTLKLNIINKMAEILAISIKKELIEMNRYQNVKVYMKYKKKYYRIDCDMDLEAGAAFSNNRVELVLREEDE